jgi:hypothetical protein
MGSAENCCRLLSGGRYHRTTTTDPSAGCCFGSIFWVVGFAVSTGMLYVGSLALADLHRLCRRCAAVFRFRFCFLFVQGMMYTNVRPWLFPSFVQVRHLTCSSVC